MSLSIPKGSKYQIERGMKVYLMPNGDCQVRKKAPWHGKGRQIGYIYSLKDLENDLFLFTTINVDGKNISL